MIVLLPSDIVLASWKAGVLALGVGLALAACSPARPALTGPAADASAALNRGDQRLLDLIGIEPEGHTIRATFGVICVPPSSVPRRRVGEELRDYDRFVDYVIAYNRALVTDPRYRFARKCELS